MSDPFGHSLLTAAEVGGLRGGPFGTIVGNLMMHSQLVNLMNLKLISPPPRA